MLTRRIIPVILLNDGMVVQTRNFRITNIIHTIPAFAIKFFGSWNADEIQYFQHASLQSPRKTMGLFREKHK